MKKIIIALAFALGMAVAHADNTFPNITPGTTDDATEQLITPPRMPSELPKREFDYSTHPVMAFDPLEWVQIGADTKEKETYWLNVKSIEPDKANFVMIGMIQYDTDKIIQGVGTNVRRVFSEALVSCSNRGVYPLRDIYTTVDFHLVSFHRHSIPQGLMLLDEVPMFKLYPAAKEKICPKK